MFLPDRETRRKARFSLGTGEIARCIISPLLCGHAALHFVKIA